MGNYTERTRQSAQRKVYVGVVSATTPEGVVTPLEITWETGRRYAISAVVDVRPAISRRSGLKGHRFTVCIGPHRTYLWQEGPRWFVLAHEERQA